MNVQIAFRFVLYLPTFTLLCLEWLAELVYAVGYSTSDTRVFVRATFND